MTGTLDDHAAAVTAAVEKALAELDEHAAYGGPDRIYAVLGGLGPQGPVAIAGRPRHPTECPLARHLQNRSGHAEVAVARTVRVHGFGSVPHRDTDAATVEILFTGGGGRREIPLSPMLTRFVDLFDRGEFGRLAAPAWETAEAGERS
jgi:hypothetical protein